MKRVYKIVSNHSEEITNKGIENLTEKELETYLNFGEDQDINIFSFDGEKCHWSEGESTLIIAFLDDEKIELLKRLDNKIHSGFDVSTSTTFEDITEEVLYSTHDTYIYGFMEDHMKHDFHKYRELYLEKDDVLDKINIHGIESLTENDKLLLQDQETIDPFDQI
jgi:hypothetical protein